MNLELVSIDDLLDELERRHATMIFSGIQTVNATTDQRQRQGKGEWLRQIGLAVDYAYYARERMKDAERDGDEDAEP